jgi:hypothetical protein
MSPARRSSMQIFANRGCFARVRRGFSALATPSAVYDVIVVKDATADYSEEFMHAALITNLPNYASASVSTQFSMEASVAIVSILTLLGHVEARPSPIGIALPSLPQWSCL